MDEKLTNPEDLKIKQLLETLGGDDGMERKKARRELVAMGIDVIDYLMELVHHPKHIYRWEALKTMEEIGEPVSIPLFIEALEDDESDIRWIAAEGLIKLGDRSIKPLLRALIEKSGSIFILAGAHHVFYDLKKAGKLPKDFPVDKLLFELKSPEWKGSVKPLADELLK
ncbi:MAG: HEAT repeat domain-containing protein [Chlorobi bacterium]|nr:HEAT repeat domain-containing protein [Chlorobiota bacterium]